MIWDFHPLIKLYVHHTVQFYLLNVSCGPSLLISHAWQEKICFVLNYKVESHVFGSIADKIDLHLVGFFGVVHIAKSDKNSLVKGFLNGYSLLNSHFFFAEVEKCVVALYCYENIGAARIIKLGESVVPKLVLVSSICAILNVLLR